MPAIEDKALSRPSGYWANRRGSQAGSSEEPGHKKNRPYCADARCQFFQQASRTALVVGESEAKEQRHHRNCCHAAIRAPALPARIAAEPPCKEKQNTKSGIESNKVEHKMRYAMNKNGVSNYTETFNELNQGN